MKKNQIANKAFPYPMPVVVVSTIVNEKINHMAVAWVTRVNINPPLIGVAINKSHHTNQGIHTHQEFGISVPSTEFIQAVDYVGLVSGAQVDKSDLFHCFAGTLKHAPMIDDCPLTMECKLFTVVNFPTHNFYIGEIVGTYSAEQYLTDGKPDICKIKPFTLTMPDNHYWGVGEDLGKAWKIGKEFIKSAPL